MADPDKSFDGIQRTAGIGFTGAAKLDGGDGVPKQVGSFAIDGFAKVPGLPMMLSASWGRTVEETIIDPERINRDQEVYKVEGFKLGNTQTYSIGAFVGDFASMNGGTERSGWDRGTTYSTPQHTAWYAGAHYTVEKITDASFKELGSENFRDLLTEGKITRQSVDFVGGATIASEKMLRNEKGGASFTVYGGAKIPVSVKINGEVTDIVVAKELETSTGTEAIEYNINAKLAYNLADNIKLSVNGGHNNLRGPIVGAGVTFSR